MPHSKALRAIAFSGTLSRSSRLTPERIHKWHTVRRSPAWQQARQSGGPDGPRSVGDSTRPSFLGAARTDGGHDVERFSCLGTYASRRQIAMSAVDLLSGPESEGRKRIFSSPPVGQTHARRRRRPDAMVPVPAVHGSARKEPPPARWSGRRGQIHQGLLARTTWRAMSSKQSTGNGPIPRFIWGQEGSAVDTPCLLRVAPKRYRKANDCSLRLGCHCTGKAAHSHRHTMAH